MKVMQIDEFLERSDDGGAPLPVPDARTYDWTRLVREGKAARQSADGGRWRIGQLASLVDRRYASGALGRFATEIGESMGSVRRFRWVVESYDPNARLRFADLSFSHFQAVASLPDRQLWLQRAQRRSWSVDRLVTESRKAQGNAGTSEALVRRPIEAATRRLARLLEVVATTPLPQEARDSVETAIDALEHQLEALRARLRNPAPAKLRRKTTKAKRPRKLAAAR